LIIDCFPGVVSVRNMAYKTAKKVFLIYKLERLSSGRLRGKLTMSSDNNRERAQTYKVTFQILLEQLLGFGVIKIDEIREDDKKFLDILRQTVESLLKKYGKSGDGVFVARRPNDVSNNTVKDNDLEDELVNYLNEQGGQFQAGKAKPTAGYPNIVVRKGGEVFCYIDVKVTSRSVTGSARDIYISPGPPTGMSVTVTDGKIMLSFQIKKGNLYRKVEQQARHLILLFRVENVGEYTVTGTRANKWKLLGCRVYDVSGLILKTKIEFNSSFKDLDETGKRLLTVGS